MSANQKRVLALISVPAFAVGWFATEAAVDDKDNMFSRWRQSEGSKLNLYPVSERK
ncbi:hypothetical protein HK101_009307, partial [Irineochytrium annulatum]